MQAPIRRVYFDHQANSFVGIEDDTLDYLRYMYPAINIKSELEKIRLWLIEHPNCAGTLGFILNWIDRDPKSKIQTKEEAQLNGVQPGSVLDKLITDYLEDMWKKTKSQDLFAFNQINQSCQPLTCQEPTVTPWNGAPRPAGSASTSSCKASDPASSPSSPPTPAVAKRPSRPS